MVASRLLLDSEQVRRSLVRIAHEILENSGGNPDLVMIGLQTRGVPLARRLSSLIAELKGQAPPVGSLDIGLYRDDIYAGKRPRMRPTSIPVSVEQQKVVLVDDVLYTGRTIRAAMDALSDFGRARQIQLAVLVDRGHRELPIRPDYVGKNIPTAAREGIRVRLNEIDSVDEVILIQKGPV